MDQREEEEERGASVALTVKMELGQKSRPTAPEDKARRDMIEGWREGGKEEEKERVRLMFNEKER